MYKRTERKQKHNRKVFQDYKSTRVEKCIAVQKKSRSQVQ